MNATAAGTIREITVKEGENVGVGALLGLIGRGSRDQAGGENATQKPAEAIEKAASDDPVEGIENGKLSPAVRRL